MKTIPLSEFRRNCSALLKQVQETNETIQVTQFGRPLVDVRPPGLSDEECAARDTRDLKLLNLFAEESNTEAEDALEPQADITDHEERPKEKKRRKRRHARTGATLKP